MPSLPSIQWQPYKSSTHLWFTHAVPLLFKFWSLAMYLCRGGDVGAHSDLYLQTEQQSTTNQPSVACTRGQLFECQRSIRKLWPSPTGSSVEAHVRPHTDKLACSCLGEPMPHHPFAVQAFFWYLQRWQCGTYAVPEFQGTRSHITCSFSFCE